MKKLSYLFAAATIVLSALSCSSSNNYLSQNYQISKPKVKLAALKSTLVKPIFVPEPLGLPESNINDEVLDRLEASTFVSSLDLSINHIIREANTYLGTPYKYGGTTRKGIDCSSFMQKIYRVEGIILPRVSYNQAKIGVPVKRNELQKGDLIFFSTTSPTRVTHVGMVVDVDNEIKFIHAASSKGVSIASLSNSYWSRRYRSARRPNQFLFDTLVTSQEAKMLASNPS